MTCEIVSDPRTVTDWNGLGLTAVASSHTEGLVNFMTNWIEIYISDWWSMIRSAWSSYQSDRGTEWEKKLFPTLDLPLVFIGPGTWIMHLMHHSCSMASMVMNGLNVEILKDLERRSFELNSKVLIINY